MNKIYKRIARNAGLLEVRYLVLNTWVTVLAFLILLVFSLTAVAQTSADLSGEEYKAIVESTFIPGEGGSIPEIDPAPAIPGHIGGLYVASNDRENSWMGGGTRPVVDIWFPAASTHAASGYKLQRSYDNGGTWADYMTTSNSSQDNFSFEPDGAAYRLFVQDGGKAGWVSNVVRVPVSGVDTRFAGWGLDESMYISGVMLPWLGRGLQASFTVKNLADDSTVAGGLGYQWYRVNPYTFDMTTITGATGLTYITTEDDLGGYQFLCRATGDGVIAGGYTEVLSGEGVVMPNRAIATNLSPSGFRLHLNKTIASLVPEDLTLSYWDGGQQFEATITSATPLEGNASFDIAVQLPLGQDLILRNTSPIWRLASEMGGMMFQHIMEGLYFSFSTLNGSIAAGGAHSLGIKGDGNLWAWGNNTLGQLGNGTNTDSSLPIQVPSLSGVTSVSARQSHNLAITTNSNSWDDTTLWAWGYNDHGQLGDGTNTDSNTPLNILVKAHSAAAGTGHSLARLFDGTIWAWGDNTYGQLGDGSNTGSLIPIKVLDDFRTVAAGYYHSLAIDNSDNLWAWGWNLYGQLGDGTTTDHSTPVKVLDEVEFMAAGDNHTLALKTDGTLWAWGLNTYGQLGDGTNQQHLTPVQVMEDVVEVEAGAEYSVALKSDGSLWAWGLNGDGQLGDGSTSSRLAPVQVLQDVTGVAAGINHSLALKTDGSLWAWGKNNFGKLGDGTTVTRLRPVQIAGFGLLVAPSNLAATAVTQATPMMQSSGAQINLSWQDNSIDEEGFRIERKTGATGDWSQIAEVGANVTSYADTGLEAGTTFYYRIQGYRGVVNSVFSNEAQATTPGTLTPPAPTNLAAAAASASQINLTWKDNSSNETGFKVESKIGATGTWKQIVTVGASVTLYSNTGLAAGSTYYFRVRAYNLSGNSPYSNMASATTPGIAAPTSLVAKAVNTSKIDLTWKDNSGNENGFKIERKKGALGSWAQIATVGANVTTYTNTGLAIGTTYYYRVRASNAGGNSSYSNVAYATTLGIAAPTSLTAKAISSARIKLDWKDNSVNETGFKIERKRGLTGTWAQIRMVGANVVTFTDTRLAAGATYYYRVRAYNGGGSSAYSNVASAIASAITGTSYE